MSKVRLLVGTRKGAFVLTSDEKRKDWKVDGPHFAGWEIYHMKGSPVDQDRLYASQTSAWFGQIIQRSDDGGKTWDTPGGGPTTSPQGMPMGESNKFVYDGVPGTHQWYDGTQHPWEFKRVWHLEPSLDDRDHVYAGDSWREVSGNLPSDFGFPIDIHAHEPETIYVVPIKSDSEHFPPDGKLRVYRSRKGGNEWEELTKGLPQRDCYVNVLRDAMTVDSRD